MFFTLPGDFSQFHFDLCTFPLHWFINTFFLCDLWECFCHINKWRGEKLTQILKHFYISLFILCVLLVYMWHDICGRWLLFTLHLSLPWERGNVASVLRGCQIAACPCLASAGRQLSGVLQQLVGAGTTLHVFAFLLNLYQSLSRRSQSIWILLSYIQWNTDSKGIHHVPKLPLLKLQISMFTINRMLF